MIDEGFEIPVVIFVFRRLDTVKKIFEVFAQIKPRKLYVFADGPREGRELEAEQVNSVRTFVDSAVTWECELHKVYEPRNKGCAPNICDGISSVFTQEESAIIFEDDAVPMVDFFEYCRELLYKYKDDKRIQYIAGFNGIGDNDSIDADYDFARFAPKSGAIAIWADRWKNCDFSMNHWPENRRNNRFKKYFYFKELYHQYISIFDDSYKGVNQGWDYQMDHDMLDNNQYAIVPKGNLAKSYGYTSLAFHPQGKSEGKRFARYMEKTTFKFNFPLCGPGEVKCNEQHDRLRQKSLLDIKGNYIYRHIYYFYRYIKDVAYRTMPKTIWKTLKIILTFDASKK